MHRKRRFRPQVVAGALLSLGLVQAVGAQARDPHAEHQPGEPGHSHPAPQRPIGGHAATGDHPGSRALPSLPEDVPRWLYTRQRGHVFHKRGPYNYAVYNVPKLARDLNAVAVGHAFAYEDLVTGKAETLETRTFDRINQVLKNPPRFMPDEAAISPTFVRRYGVLEMVFDWTHVFHAQTVDVLASTRMTEAEKDAEIEALWRYYYNTVPWRITPLPMHMGYLDSQPYSQAFRRRYPKVNGLFWGYHWLQGTMYDTLYGKTLAEQRAAYEEVHRQYHGRELYRTDRPFMPMFAELSPRFAQRFPHISNTFDNLHMLHDLINDILASDWMTKEQKREQILRAVWMVSADAHEGERPGDVKEPGGLHDHRHMPGIPGMGMMPEGHDHGAHGHPAAAPSAGPRHPGSRRR